MTYSGRLHVDNVLNKIPIAEDVAAQVPGAYPAAHAEGGEIVAETNRAAPMYLDDVHSRAQITRFEKTLALLGLDGVDELAELEAKTTRNWSSRDAVCSVRSRRITD